jgi:Tfp pilus assembly protein PilF
VLGIAYLATGQQQAASLLEESARINPYDSRTWLSLSTVYGVSNPAKQYGATMEALAVDHTNVDVEWEASQLLLQNGEIDQALRLLREVSTYDSVKNNRVIQSAFRATGGDVSRTLEAVPPTAIGRLQLLRWLLEHDKTSAADRVWPSVVEAKGSVPARDLFFYLDSLIGRHEVGRAQSVWKWAGSNDSDLRRGIETGNLFVNGDFESDLLNGGFAWRYAKTDGVTVTMDTSTFHGGTRSLSLQLDVDRIADAGIYQLVPVEPGSRFSIDGFAHSEELESANGVRLAIVDYYSNAVLFSSEEILGSTSWKELSGELTTPSDCRLVKLSIVRSPSFGRIRGRVWLDDLRMEKRP